MLEILEPVEENIFNKSNGLKTILVCGVNGTGKTTTIGKLCKILKDNNSKVIVPSVFDDFSSKNVLTMEYLPGIKVTNVEALDKKNIDRQQLVIDVHQIFFTMLLKHSIFHADPHPGNISVTDEGKLSLYDYGMV